MNLEPYRSHKHDFPQYSYTPKINNFSTTIDRTVTDLLKWNQTKQIRQELMKKYFEMKQQSESEQLCFTNEKSNQMIQFTRPQNEPIENILIQKGEEAKAKLRDKENQLYQKSSIPNITKRAQNLMREGCVFDRLHGQKQISKSISEARMIPSKSELQIAISPTRQVISQQFEKRASDPNILMPLSSWIRKNQKAYQQKQLEMQQNEEVNIMNISIRNQEEQQEQQAEQEEINQTIKEVPIKHCFFSLVQEQQKLQENMKNNRNRSNSNQRIRKKKNISNDNKHQKKSYHQSKGITNNKQQYNKLYEYILDGDDH